MQQPVSQSQTVQAYLLSLKLVPLALIAGPVFFLLAILYLTADQLVFDFEQVDIAFWGAAIVLTPIVIVGGSMLSNRILLAGEQKKTLKGKTNAYFVANLIRLALLEGGILFNIALIFLTTNAVFLIFWFFLILIQITNLPSKNKLIQVMKLSREETKLLDNPQAILK